LPSRVNFDTGQGLFSTISKMVDNAQEQGKSRSAVALKKGYGGTSAKAQSA
jgi:hypothetical protein